MVGCMLLANRGKMFKAIEGTRDLARHAKIHCMIPGEQLDANVVCSGLSKYTTCKKVLQNS